MCRHLCRHFPVFEVSTSSTESVYIFVCPCQGVSEVDLGLSYPQANLSYPQALTLWITLRTKRPARRVQPLRSATVLPEAGLTPSAKPPSVRGAHAPCVTSDPRRLESLQHLSDSTLSLLCHRPKSALLFFLERNWYSLTFFAHFSLWLLPHFPCWEIRAAALVRTAVRPIKQTLFGKRKELRVRKNIFLN